MEDREITETLAEFCGLDGEWVKENELHLYSCAGYVYGDCMDEHFAPLTDANDEMEVLILFRKQAQEHGVYQSGWLKFINALIDSWGQSGVCEQLADWLLAEREIGDIARAVAKAI